MKSHRARNVSLGLTVGMLLLKSFVLPACAQNIPYGLEVSVGYLNNLDGQPAPFTSPVPFDASGNSALISSGPETAPHDTGVIRLVNYGFFPVLVLDGLTVTVQGHSFTLWDRIPRPPGTPGPASPLRLPIQLDPGDYLVLAETENFNFDTSNLGLSKIPSTVHVGINVGMASVAQEDIPEHCQLVPPTTTVGQIFLCDFTDTGRVLLGHEEAVGNRETTPYQRIGTITPALEKKNGPFVTIIGRPTCRAYTLANLGNAVGSFSITRAQVVNGGSTNVSPDIPINTVEMLEPEATRTIFFDIPASDLPPDVPRELQVDFSFDGQFATQSANEGC
jgi:hypothetical protein